MGPRGALVPLGPLAPREALGEEETMEGKDPLGLKVQQDQGESLDLKGQWVKREHVVTRERGVRRVTGALLDSMACLGLRDKQEI